MVFYRKYRPQQISELDLLHVREKLSAILSSKDLPHAFLFTGPKGLGKTSSARILAKAINCQNKKGIEPCNECDICISITNGSHMDIMEIDAASNRGVDEIRELRERVKYSPSQVVKKIYIIDEVHMLTTEAFNALLKTLEEPPGHVIFVLCTTEMWKLPATIISRTFVIQFEKPREEELVRSLTRITLGEKMKIDTAVLGLVYARSEGSFRDAAKTLEELALSARDVHITPDIFESLFKSFAIQNTCHELITSLSQKDVQKALGFVQNMSNAGYDFRVVLEELSSYLRQLVFAKTGVASSIHDIPQLSLTDIKKLLEELQNAYQYVRISPIPQLPLELVVIGFCVSEEKATKVPSKNPEMLSPKPVAKVVEPSKYSSAPADFLTSLIAEIKKENYSLAGILRSGKIEKELDGELIISTPYEFHAKKLNDAKVLILLQEKVTALKGKPYTVVVEQKK